MRAVLSLAYGAAGRVRTPRTGSRVGSTHVHLERVAHRRDVLARAVRRAAGARREAGVEDAHYLMASLGMAVAPRLEGAAVALLTPQHAARTVPRTGRDPKGRARLPLLSSPNPSGGQEHQARVGPKSLA